MDMILGAFVDVYFRDKAGALKERTIKNKSYITTSKMKQSVWVIDIPQFLTKETEMYVNRCYGLPDNERLFQIVAEVVQHKLKHVCEIGCKAN